MKTPSAPDSARTGDDPCRILLLTSATGGGHNSRARALEAWLKQDYGDAVEVHIEEILERSSRILRLGVWFYNVVQRHYPRLHSVYWHVAEHFVRMQTGSVTWGGAYYRRLVSRYRPHLILSVHDSANRGYFEDARKLLGQGRVSCVTYCGEWSGGKGYSLNWLNLTADHYISRTEEAQAFALEQGLAANRARVFCNLLPPHHFQGSEKPPAAVLRQSLGLSAERLTLLFSTGMNSANRHLGWMEELLPFGDRIQCIVICGRSEAVKRKVDNWRAAHADFKVMAEGYSQRVHELLQASDAVISRGGSNTATEALFHQCPLIFDLRAGLMPQEGLTVRYFHKHQACALIRDRGDLRAVVNDWLDTPDSLEALRRNFAAIRQTDHPQELARDLVAWAREAQRA